MFASVMDLMLAMVLAIIFFCSVSVDAAPTFNCNNDQLNGLGILANANVGTLGGSCSNNDRW